VLTGQIQAKNAKNTPKVMARFKTQDISIGISDATRQSILLVFVMSVGFWVLIILGVRQIL
jgi:hypothetical protein